jgi:chemosensory pili system protein ChpA (sensor histidine kinase/response regulator)
MDSLRNPSSASGRGAEPESPSDLSALSWVHDELRRSIELALKAVRRHARELEVSGGPDDGLVDPAQLQAARQHLHHGVGALELTGLPAGASVLRACEAAVQRFGGKPRLFDAQAAQTLERALFALLDYLERVLAGKLVSPLSMFPQYQAVQQLAAADRVHPADLWDFEWRWVALPVDARAQPRVPDAATRSAVEGKMLALMRGSSAAAATQMIDIFAGLGAGASDARAATLWKLAAAMFEAQSQGLLKPDVFSTRVVSRLLALLRSFERGGADVPDLLARELLFFCAQADRPGEGDTAPRLAAVRLAYGLERHVAADYQTSSLGRFDPALIAQALKRVAAAKESWSEVAAGEMHRLHGLGEQFSLVGESLKRLFPFGDALSGALHQAAGQAQQSGAPPSAALAMEVATSLLYVEACLEDGDFDHPQLGVRAQRLSERMADVREGASSQPLEGWMEDLYRRVSDRQTMGSVVRELRASLSEAERQIDLFFRNPGDSRVLIPVPQQLAAMRGVLSVLGMDHAVAALLRMRDELDGLTSTEIDVSRVSQAGVFDRLASNLGALGFLIDMLAVQPALAKTLFVYDADAGTLSPVMGRSGRAPVRLGEPAPSTQVPASAELSATDAARAPAAAAAPTAPPAPVDEAADPEMREVFLEEAREVVDNAREACVDLAHASDDLQRITLVRRAFHTLKGSARMVGLGEFAEAAWVCEQLFNTLLSEQRAADAPLLEFTGWSLEQLGSWVDDIAASRDTLHSAERIREAARQLHAPALVAAVEPTPSAAESPEFEPAFDLDLSVSADDAQESAAASDAQTAPIDLDLADFGSMFGPLGIEATRPMSFADEAARHASLPEPAATPDVDLSDLDLDLDLDMSATGFTPALTAPAEVEPAQPDDEAAGALPVSPSDEEFRLIGPLRIHIALFNIYLNEADEWSRQLGTELAEWAHDLERPVGETAVALAHSLAGSSATVGFAELSQLARTLEHALDRSCAMGAGTPHEAALFGDAADEIRSLLHQFAAGFLKSPSDELLARLSEHELTSAQRLESVVAELDASTFMDSGAVPLDLAPDGLEAPTVEPLVETAPVAETEDDIDAVDALQPELFPIFAEEAEELFGKLANRLQDWSRSPDDAQHGAGAMRDLHTLKGAARLAGAMRLGEMLHRLESRIESLTSVLAETPGSSRDIEPLLARCDTLQQVFEALRHTVAAEAAATQLDVAEPEPIAASGAGQPSAVALEVAESTAEPALAADGIDWSRFRATAAPDEVPAVAAHVASTSAVRVRAPLLDRLVNQAGEVSITRSRIASDVGHMKDSLADLSENLERLRGQLHDIEMQAETQISSHMEAAKSASEEFDPLEFDRYTRLQELTRMMAESVNDVATVQRTLQKSLQSTEDELAAQGRLTRELQDDLLRTRMVEFEGLSERLHRVVRQAAKETGKQVRLDIEGGSIEIDRGVLDRMTGAFEHLLRNSVTHGIESPALRVAAGKDATGSVVIAVSQSGNEVSVEVRDDGRGLDLTRIREKARAGGLVAAGHAPSDGELANLIFRPGFSTAEKVTELAGRGVGLDVVRSEVDAIGGRIETATTAGRGTEFKLSLPLTTAVTQVVMVRCGELKVGVPSTLVDMVRRVPAAEAAEAARSGRFSLDNEELPFFWLGALLQTSARSTEVATRASQVLIVRSASQRMAVHVDDVLGNQEVVVKNLGPQLSRMPGLAGMTLLAAGDVALIYNPVALAALYGAAARSATQAANADGASQAAVIEPPLAPLVLVVDDSLTVRRVTERMLLREGYRVTLAKDGLDAMERLAQEKPAIVLSDIEMPRMDGFDLVRNLRADPLLHDLPVIMITSRIAQKHREHAAQLGVNHYLGKPYSEEDLLALISQCTGHLIEAHGT